MKGEIELTNKYFSTTEQYNDWGNKQNPPTRRMLWGKIQEKDQRIAELGKQLAIRNKALEMACNLAIDLDNNNNTFGYSILDKYFIKQAEEALKKLEENNVKD